MPYSISELEDLPLSELTYEKCMALAKQAYHPYADNRSLLYFIPKCFHTRDLCLTVLQRDGNALRDVPMDLRDWELCLAAVTNHGEALIDVPKELRDKELCTAAVEEYGQALLAVPRQFWTDELIIKALHTAPQIMSLLPDDVKTLRMCRYALRNDWSAQMTRQSIPPALMNELRGT